MEDPSGPVMAYLDALDAFNRATNDMEGVVAGVQEVARTLQSWQKVVIKGSRSGFPVEMLINPDSPTIDLQNWPSAERLTQMLLAWHEAKKAMDEAWDVTPPARRASLPQRPVAPK